MRTAEQSRHKRVERRSRAGLGAYAERHVDA